MTPRIPNEINIFLDESFNENINHMFKRIVSNLEGIKINK